MANAVAVVLFGLLVGSEVLIFVKGTRHPGESHDHGTGLVIALCLPGAFAGALVAANADLGPVIAGQRLPLVLAGTALATGGLALRFWAIATLGPFFNQQLVVQRLHEVVTDGPFRVVRHPSYAGPILVFVAIGLVLDTWVGLAICLVLPIGAYAWRITVEERMLVAGLGTAYERYREQTWRIVPGIW